MDIVELYNSLKELPYEDYCVLKNKISEFHNNGIDSNKIYKLIKQYCSVKSFCDIKTINNADYIDFIKILKIATFLKGMIYLFTPLSRFNLQHLFFVVNFHYHLVLKTM